MQEEDKVMLAMEGLAGMLEEMAEDMVAADMVAEDMVAVDMVAAEMVAEDMVAADMVGDMAEEVMTMNSMVNHMVSEKDDMMVKDMVLEAMLQSIWRMQNGC